MEKIINDIIDKKTDEIIKSTRELVRIKSVLEEPGDKGKPFGDGIREALDRSLEMGEGLGLRVKNLDGYAGYLEMGKGNGLAGILTHIDVVPEGSGWEYPPYSGEVISGKLYGRGSVDDKGPTVASMYALYAVMASGLPVRKRARLIIGTDEENKARGIKYYLEKEEKPIHGFSPDAMFPIINAEKGILRIELTCGYEKAAESGDIVLNVLTGGARINMVPDYASAEIETGPDGQGILNKALDDEEEGERLKVSQKEPGKFFVESFGKSAHAMSPEDGTNAIAIILEFVDKLKIKPAGAGKLIRFFAKHVGQDANGRGLGVDCSDKISGELTMNLGLIDFSGERGKVTLDIRYPVTDNKERIMEMIKQLCRPLGIEVTELQHKFPLHVDGNSELIKKLQEVYQQVTDCEPGLIAIGGGTYCRYIDNFVAFGPVFPGQQELAHQANENIAVSDLIKITKIYGQAIYSLIK